MLKIQLPPRNQNVKPRMVLGFDAISAIKIKRVKAFKPKAVFVDSLIKVKRKTEPLRLEKRPLRKTRKFWANQRFFLPTLSLVVIISISYIAGAYLTWQTEETSAESQALPQVLGASTIKVYDSPPGQVADVPNDVFFNLTLEQLENYLAEALKTPAMKEAERLADRKIKLKAYLEERRSPFVEIVDTIAELKHWKMVLAVSNSESSLGKRCYNNNCSGIGVEPGHPLWRDYSSKAEWAKDLDRLLEKRYKDWTLEKMNGVYNHPGSQNWLYASKQVLEELQERSIE